MSKWIEKEKTPGFCLLCDEEECYNCDNALDRWEISEEDYIKNTIRFKITHIKFLKRQLEAAEVENKKGIKDSYIKLLHRQIKDLKKEIVDLERKRDKIIQKEG
jgi:hypothetical protein